MPGCDGIWVRYCARWPGSARQRASRSANKETSGCAAVLVSEVYRRYDFGFGLKPALMRVLTCIDTSFALNECGSNAVHGTAHPYLQPASHRGRAWRRLSRCGRDYIRQISIVPVVLDPLSSVTGLDVGLDVHRYVSFGSIDHKIHGRGKRAWGLFLVSSIAVFGVAVIGAVFIFRKCGLTSASKSPSCRFLRWIRFCGLRATDFEDLSPFSQVGTIMAFLPLDIQLQNCYN